MQDFLKQTVNQEYNTYSLAHNILVMFDRSIEHEVYSTEDYHGIIFFIKNDGNILTGNYGHYDVINNRHMGNRILISNKDGWRDIPFKAATFYLLPSGVKAIEI